MPDFLPRQDGELAPWVSVFAQQLTTRPEVYHVTAEAAAAYAVLSDAFVQKFDITSAGGTRTPSEIAGKDDARAAVVALTRQIVRRIRGIADISDQDLIDIGLRPHKANRSKRPTPARAPQVQILSVDGNIVRLKLNDAETARRARPANASGATILFAASERLGSGTGWNYAAATSKTTIDIVLPATLPFGTRVFTACWNGHSSANSPYSSPIGVRITESPLLVA